MHRTLLIGDVHGCARELEDLLEIVTPSRVYLAGDLFTRGPDPRGVWRLIQRFEAHSVLGNHDARMLEVWDDAVRGTGRGKVHRAIHALEGDPAVRAWISALPTAIEAPGWVLVHAGVHPKKGLAGSSRAQRLEIRRWPDDAELSNLHWWKRFAKHHAPGDHPLVIHGHDAVQGLRDQRPLSLGLDGGCVFGGSLCGYILEEDRLLQVPARKVWLAPGS
jgi:hypothetical protein